jgi:hypothetical protein
VILAYLCAQLHFSVLAFTNLVNAPSFVVLMFKHVMQRICCRRNPFVGGRVEVDLTAPQKRAHLKLISEFTVARFVELMFYASNPCVEHVFQHGQFPSAAIKKVGGPKKTFRFLRTFGQNLIRR